MKTEDSAQYVGSSSFVTNCILVTARYPVIDDDGQYLNNYIDDKPVSFLAASPYNDQALLNALSDPLTLSLSLSSVLCADIQRLLIRPKLLRSELMSWMEYPKQIQGSTGVSFGHQYHDFEQR